MKLEVVKSCGATRAENLPIFRSQTLTEWEFVRSKLAKGLEMVRKKKVHTFFIFNSVIEFWAEFSKNVSFHCFLFDDGYVILNHVHVKYDWQMLDQKKKQQQQQQQRQNKTRNVGGATA